MRPLRVAVLLHERDLRAHRIAYSVWHLARAWAEHGVAGRAVEVTVERGTKGRADADVVVNHLDLTVVPPAYLDYLARFPVALNAGCPDLSKRRVSAAALAPGERWDGPVIVKTDANCGGIGEERLEREPLPCRLARAARLAGAALGGARARERERWRRLRRLPSEDYPVFPSLREVPEGVLENPALVVERFLPEREGSLYALRTHTRLGDRHRSRRVLAAEPVVKANRTVLREEIEPNPEVVAAADRLRLDYGKVDYVVHEGRVVVLDANRTPTYGPRLDEAARKASAEALAPGLAAFLRSGELG
jgi:hypothetical protein